MIWNIYHIENDRMNDHDKDINGYVHVNRKNKKIINNSEIKINRNVGHEHGVGNQYLQVQQSIRKDNYNEFKANNSRPANQDDTGVNDHDDSKNGKKDEMKDEMKNEMKNSEEEDECVLVYQLNNPHDPIYREKSKPAMRPIVAKIEEFIEKRDTSPYPYRYNREYHEKAMKCFKDSCLNNEILKALDESLVNIAMHCCFIVIVVLVFCNFVRVL